MKGEMKPAQKNAFAEKYRQKMNMRDMDRQAKGASVPAVLRRKALSKAKK